MGYREYMAGLALAIFGILAAPITATGQEGSDSPAAVLEGHGYGADAYAIVMHWQEYARDGEGALINGCRLAPRDGSPLFDVYWDQTGVLLEEAAQAALGIRAKNWFPRAIDVATEIQPGFPKIARRGPTPMSPRRYGRISELGLPPPDVDRARREDEAGESGMFKGVERISVFVDLLKAVEVTAGAATEGVWRISPEGGRIWALSLRSLGALGLRIHFSALEVPEGGRMVVYNAEDPAEAYGPFKRGKEIWTPTCFGEAVAVECYIPFGVDAGSLYFAIDRVTHQYKSIEYFEKAGACNLDVSCYPAWQTTSLAVGGIGTIGTTGGLWCTGSLLADANPDTQIPYFLTANHCVGSAARADTIEVYWLYQSESCGGTVPALSSVPRTTGGAALLATSNVDNSGNDFSLLRLRQAPPEGLAFLGFATGPAAVGADVVTIHHPSGSYKRISFGEITDAGSPSRGSRLQPIARFHEVLWTQATTEHGSSGSPLFLARTQQVIGQLWGGLASCSLPDEPDYFGRFDWTFPIVEPWLGTPIDPYDVDKSGDVDALDLQLTINAALARTPLEAADVDFSGNVDAVDVQLVTIAVMNAGD